MGGLTEDYSLEDSLSVSSDELLQGHNGDISIYVIVVKGIRAIKAHLGRLLLVMRRICHSS